MVRNLRQTTLNYGAKPNPKADVADGAVTMRSVR